MRVFVDAGLRKDRWVACVAIPPFPVNPRDYLTTIYKLTEKTNNEAEYKAMICGMSHLAPGDGTVCSDSLLVVRQLEGKWKVSEPRLKPYHAQAKQLMDRYGIMVEWVPREKNHAGIFMEKSKKWASGELTGA